MRILILFLLSFSLLYSLEIDIESFKREAQNDPSNVKARLILAHEYISKENFDEAKKVLTQILEIDKNHPKANSLMIEVKKNQGIEEIKKTENTFTRVDELENIYKTTNSFEDFKLYYYELEGLGNQKLGFTKLESFVREYPTDENAVLFLANQYHWMKRVKKSLKVLKPVIDTTLNIDVLTLYANLLYQSGKDKEALKQYKRAYKLGADDNVSTKNINAIKKNLKKSKTKKRKKGLKNKAERYFARKDYLKAIPLYKKYFQRVSNDSYARFHYATALENLKKYDKAEKQYLIVSQQIDKLYELSTYRYARVMIVQRDEAKWENARVVLENLLDTLVNNEPSKENDDILHYTQKSLEIVSQPMPTATMHKDVMLTAEQSKILDSQTFSANIIENQNVSSVKTMINPRLSSVENDTDIEAKVFGSIVDDDSMKNNYYGVLVGNQAISIEAKKSTFKSSEANKSTKLDASSIRASYNNGDNFAISLGVNSFEDSTTVVGKLEYSQSISNHNITYALEYQNGVFINGATCMIENDINTISLSLYDLILMNNLEQTELMITINSFSDSNLNINSWANYPIYRMLTDSLENSFSLVGNYEYNSKKDTCYGAAEFFDNSQIEMKSKYQFASGGFMEATGSIGYSFKNQKLLYSYGVMLQLISANSLDIYIDCKHYQSGYSPNGANECYASVSHVW